MSQKTTMTGIESWSEGERWAVKVTVECEDPINFLADLRAWLRDESSATRPAVAIVADPPPSSEVPAVLDRIEAALPSPEPEPEPEPKAYTRPEVGDARFGSPIAKLSPIRGDMCFALLESGEKVKFVASTGEEVSRKAAPEPPSREAMSDRELEIKAKLGAEGWAALVDARSLKPAVTALLGAYGKTEVIEISKELRSAIPAFARISEANFSSRVSRVVSML